MQSGMRIIGQYARSVSATAVITLLCCILNTAAQADPATATPFNNELRPKIALVLSGGGAIFGLRSSSNPLAASVLVWAAASRLKHNSVTNTVANTDCVYRPIKHPPDNIWMAPKIYR